MSHSSSPTSPLATTLYWGIVTTALLLLLTDHIPNLPSLAGYITPPLMLFVGLAFALVFGQPAAKWNKMASKWLLQTSVVGLGFGLHLSQAWASGREGMLFTILSVAGTLLVGTLLGRYLLHTDRRTSYLLSAGTAICGGSAIAAVGPAIKAKDSEMSVALGTVFLLNAAGLFLFPTIGHWLGLSQHDFGTWAAIAIHDTSSVVGAGATYGEEALQVATTVKLTRALWIVPVVVFTTLVFRTEGRRVSVPWFIVGFVLAMLCNTFFLASYPELGAALSRVARQLLTLTMFFIGASLSLPVLRSVGVRSFVQAVLLWLIISVGSLVYILW